MPTYAPARAAVVAFWSALLLSSAAPCARAQDASAPPPQPARHRWLDWQSASLDSRYRHIVNSAGRTTTHQQQLRETARARFTFDSEARYSIETFVHTGGSFTSSWDALGPGTGDPTWDLNVRQLFFAARPVQGVELQFGGLGIARGEQTEITTFDNDGFMTGERATVRRPAKLFLDEITVTTGFLGDVRTPNVFHRFDRLDDHNYTQVLVMKKAGSRVRLSADWMSLDGVSTVREAIRVATDEWFPLDAVRFETYQRREGCEGPEGCDGAAAGFAVSVERALTSRLGVSGGYADIDRDYDSAIAADHFGPGRRLFGEAKIAVLPVFSVSIYYGAGVGNDFPLPNDRRLDIIASWNLLKTAQRAGLW